MSEGREAGQGRGVADGWGGDIDRRRFLRVGGVVTVGMLGGWSGAPDPGPDGDVSELPPRVVGLRSMGGAFRFDPAGLRIEVGSQLHWLNMGDFHTVSAFHPDNASLVSQTVPLRIPEGAESFHSGMLGLTAGSRFSHRFQIEGVYDYFCQPHYSFGMVGRIVVGEASDGPALSRPEDDLVESARGQLPPVASIVGPEAAIHEWTARINGILYTMANDGDGAVAADAVATRAMSDDALVRRLDGDGRDALEQAFSDLVSDAKGSAGYEAVLRRADEAKRVLREGSPSR